MDRKKFLVTSSLAVLSISAFGRVRNVGENKFLSDCETTNDILGPFYRPDAPTRNDLTYKGLEGNIVEIKGKVMKADCVTPLKNALVEIWHCNKKGSYDNDSNNFNQRAKWFTNENGEYSFKTILPGKYLNGKVYRPAHIHFRVTEENSKELISQLYFTGDPHITTDPWASNKNAKERILPIILEDTTGNLAVTFNIFLREK